MLSKWQWGLLTALGLAAIVLVAAHTTLQWQNRAAQAQLAQRQQFVAQTAPLETLYREIVKALADLAVKAGDRQIIDMLTAQGVNITVNAPAAPAPVAPAAAPK